MLRKKIAFILACLGILSAVWAVKRAMAPPPPKSELGAQPVQKPYLTSIAATGMIEAVGENIALGAPSDGLVQAVLVEVWQKVKKGDPLFQLDCRELEATLKIDQAKEEVALAEHKRIYDQLERLRSIKDMRAISQDELRSKENEARVTLAKVHQARMEKEKTLALLERLTIRSPIDGVIIQKNIRPGEFLLSSQLDASPLIIGDMSLLQVRVDIDEQNASRMVKRASAIAYPKNQPSYAIPLTFVRIEPYVTPKRSLTGSSKEKVDTRVLQTIYTFTPPEDISLYIGQQVDVYIERDLSKEVSAKKNE